MFFLMRKVSVTEAKAKGWSGETKRRYVMEVNDFGRDVYFPVEKVPALYKRSYDSFNRHSKEVIVFAAMIGAFILFLMLCFGVVLHRFIKVPTLHDVYGLTIMLLSCLALTLALIKLGKNPYEKR